MTHSFSILPEGPARAIIRDERFPTLTVRQDHSQAWQVGSSHDNMFSAALTVVLLGEAARRDAHSGIGIGIGMNECDSAARKYRTSTPRSDRRVVGCRTPAVGPCREFRHRTGCHRGTFPIFEADLAGTKPLRGAQLALHSHSTTTTQHHVEREIGAGLG